MNSHTPCSTNLCMVYGRDLSSQATMSSVMQICTPTIQTYQQFLSLFNGYDQKLWKRMLNKIRLCFQKLNPTLQELKSDSNYDID